MSLILSADQEAAVGAFLGFLLDPEEKEMVLTGSAGTGKTTLMQHILEILRQQGKITKILACTENKFNVYLTSTTNKAAKVLQEITGEHTVTTIHSLLGLKPIRNYKTGVETFKRSEQSTVIKGALIIIDEASMINADLLKIIRESTHNCKILFVGDQYQLPPVFEKECPAFSKVPFQAKLTSIQRQVEGSPIIQVATAFRDAVDSGVFPVVQSVGDAILHADRADFKDMIDSAYEHQKYDDDVRVVAWTNRKVVKYNNYIRGLHTSKELYQEGERVLVNSAIVGANGDVAFRTDQIATVTKSRPAIQKYDLWGNYIFLNNVGPLFVPFSWDDAKAMLDHLAKHKNWSKFFELKDVFCDIRPIYCNSVHKSQGSTYGTVFIDLNDIGKNTKDYEIARLMYVAISRASERVIMFGDLPRRLYR